MTFSTKDGQGTSSNNSCHIYPTAQQVHVYQETMLPFCGAVVKMVSDGHHHDGAQKSGSCLDRTGTLIEVRLCTWVKVWRFDCYLTPLSTKNSASRAVVMMILGVKAQMCEG